ncbi:hypothetical protein A605_09210 [Corynebacterium halotolerans YIM 70093 = DSM 44683]|uniref:YbjN domain-containing protein n=1 Tax=Corynebacterium halotolerans YIM 70093 = DSM 44683 TaxID=1121362 RepID=M1MYP9_9CORY|nr:hypothetical protein A605_09210 [Corynebacterium halotolerans YIM 70093 = DSM 44683]
MTLTRVYVAAESYGFHSYIGADRLVFPWRDHLVTVYVDDRNPQALVFDTDLRIMLEMGDIGELAPLVNTWNRERLGPTLSLRVGDAGEITVHARSSILIGTGVSDEQLAESVRGAMETSLLAVTHLAVTFPELALPDSDDPADDLELHRNEQDSAAIDGPLPRERHHRAFDDDATVEELLAALPGEDWDDTDNPDSAEGGSPPGSSWRQEENPDQPGLFPPPEETPPLFHLDDVDASRFAGRARRRAHGIEEFDLFGEPVSPREGEDDAGEDADTGRYDEVYLDGEPDTDYVFFPEPDEEHLPMMNRHHDGSDHSNPQLPGPVTIDRIRGMLMELGVEKTQGGDEVIVAWINEVLFGFFVDNGPSYLVKGHWDPNLDPETDFLRMFLLCNDWNEASISTKAFCHEDADGLQVRVEFTTPVGEGLNDAQLEHNTAVAINQVLHAIDSISTDATGESAVHWP